MFGFALFFIVIAALCVYRMTLFYARGFSLPYRSAKARWARIGISLAVGIFAYFVRVATLAILYLFVLLELCNLFRFLWKKLVKKEWNGKWFAVCRRIFHSGAIPILAVCILFGVGYTTMNDVQKTVYSVSSSSLSQNYRVVFLSDIHYATVQSESLLQEKVEEINALSPDIVILGGDIVEEGTSFEAMQRAFATLGKLRATHGVYFVYGNHDRQRYSASPSYTEEDLDATIRACGIQILREEAVRINTDLILLGREDALDTRLSAQTWRAQLEADRFLLVADHQPTRAESNAQIGAQAQLSGHTHAGQIFPLGLFSFLFDGFVYGECIESGMPVFVSSGFAGWGFPIRTQGVSEYVVLELIKE